MIKYKIKTIDKRQRIGAVYPTKAKTSKNVQTDTTLKEWTNPDYIIELFDRFGKEIARLKNQRRDRLKKRGYTGIELKNQALHFWALRNYSERKQAENEIISHNDVMRISAPKLRGKSTITKLDFNFKHIKITDDLLELQLMKETRITQELRDRKDLAKLEKARKLIEDFYTKEREKLKGFKPLDNKNKLTIKLENFEFDFDLEL